MPNHYAQEMLHKLSRQAADLADTYITEGMESGAALRRATSELGVSLNTGEFGELLPTSSPPSGRDFAPSAPPDSLTGKLQTADLLDRDSLGTGRTLDLLDRDSLGKSVDFASGPSLVDPSSLQHFSGVTDPVKLQELIRTLQEQTKPRRTGLMPGSLEEFRGEPELRDGRMDLLRKLQDQLAQQQLTAPTRKPTLSGEVVPAPETAPPLSTDTAATDDPQRTVFKRQHIGNNDFLKNLGTADLPSREPITFDDQPDADLLFGVDDPMLIDEEIDSNDPTLIDARGPETTAPELTDIAATDDPPSTAESVPSGGVGGGRATAWTWPDGRPVTLQEANDPSIPMETRQTWIRKQPSSTGEDASGGRLSGILSQLFGKESGGLGFNLLDVLGKAGGSLAANRAVGQANKKDAASGARANLINALSSKRVAQGSRSQPKMGLLGSLSGAASAAGQAGLGMQAQQREQEQLATQNTQINRRLKAMEMTAASGKTNSLAAMLRAMNSGTTAGDGTGLSVSGAESLARAILERMGDNVPGSFGAIIAALSDEERELFESLEPGARIEVLANILSPEGSGEKLMDTKSFLFALDETERAWKGAAFTGTVASVGNLFFDFEEGGFGRRMAPDTADLVDQLSSMGLIIAKQLQGARASDLDLRTAARALPRQTDSDELAARKFERLRRAATGDYGRITGVDDDGVLIMTDAGTESQEPRPQLPPIQIVKRG